MLCAAKRIMRKEKAPHRAWQMREKYRGKTPRYFPIRKKAADIVSSGSVPVLFLVEKLYIVRDVFHHLVLNIARVALYAVGKALDLCPVVDTAD